jgi:hypothetical protein
VPLSPRPAIGALLKHHGYRFSFRAPTGGRLRISWSAVLRARGEKSKRIVLARTAATFSVARARTLEIALTRAGTHLLMAVDQITVTATARFSPPGSPSVLTTRQFALTR